MTEPSGRRPPPPLPATQLAVLTTLLNEGIQVPPAARRRWRRQALQRERSAQLEWIATDGASERYEEIQPPFAPRLVATVERVCELRQTPSAASKILGDWDGTAPDPGDLAQAADYAALLLEVFSRLRPVDDAKLETVHKELVAKAFVSVLEITRRLRALEASPDAGREELEEPSLNIYSGCSVCYAAVANVLLIPCAHLALCEVCVVLSVGEEWWF